MEAMDSARSSVSGDGIDLRLREALSPAPQAVERIVCRALDPEAREAAATPRRLLLPASLAAVLALALALAVAIPRQPAEGTISISNVGSVVIARSARGEGLVIQSGGSQPSNPNEQILIVYGGDR
jgi:hypothetical protein